LNASPLIALVTGTYNRLPLLQRMIASFERSLPRHINYEIILVDGGSTDGTPEWCAGNNRIRLIQHGGLRGAIAAFCDGARCATADYVLLANDDVEFRPGGVMAAVAHLERNRACGAVAFADNRSQQLGYAATHRTEVAPGRLQDGQKTMFTYAQVGLFRRWLGDTCGWWGDQDEVMRHARTYGGDNYLSSRIWEIGYTVDAVEGCAVDDLIARDQLRAANGASGSNDSKRYYERYPQGALYPGAPIISNPQPERLRLLVLPIYERSHPAAMNREYGLSEALAKAGLTWEIDFQNDQQDIVAAVKAWQPDLMLVQFHGANKRLNAHVLSLCRREKPDMVIVSWNGDAHEEGLAAPDVIEALRQVDLQTVVNAAVLPRYAELGIRAAYWQIGYKDPVGAVPRAPRYEVLWLANCYSERRKRIAELLHGLAHVVGIFGNCPGAYGNTHYDFAMSTGLYQQCTLAISDTFPGTVGYVSNRLFQALAAGAFVLQEHSPQLETYNGLRAGTHYIEWRSLEELEDLINYWIKSEHRKERARIARAGMKYVRANFSYDAQVKKLWELL